MDIEVVDALSSKTSVHGDYFAIRLGTPIVIDGRTLVSSGVTGVGEVIQGAKARAAGKPGELIITARWLDDGAIRLPLGHFNVAETGRDRSGAAMAVALAASSVLSLLVVGGEVIIPAGTHATAKLTQNVDLLLTPAPQVPTQTPTVAATAAAPFTNRSLLGEQQ